jgi:hypothetical protein
MICYYGGKRKKVKKVNSFAFRTVDFISNEKMGTNYGK